MPPIRTRNKKFRGLLALPGPVIGLEAYEGATAAAEQRAPQSAGEATMCLPSETEESRLVDEAKGADAAQKTSMPMNRGQKDVAFRGNQEWNSNYWKWLGYETKRVAFGSGFVLKDQHINELTSIGPRLCHSLTRFEFHFDDVSYDAKNSAAWLSVFT